MRRIMLAIVPLILAGCQNDGLDGQRLQAFGSALQGASYGIRQGAVDQQQQLQQFQQQRQLDQIEQNQRQILDNQNAPVMLRCSYSYCR